MWWRPDFESLLYPYLPPNIKKPKVILSSYIFALFTYILCSCHKLLITVKCLPFFRSALNSFLWSCHRAEGLSYLRTSEFLPSLCANFMRMTRYVCFTWLSAPIITNNASFFLDERIKLMIMTGILNLAYLSYNLRCVIGETTLFADLWFDNLWSSAVAIQICLQLHRTITPQVESDDASVPCILVQKGLRMRCFVDRIICLLWIYLGVSLYL